MSETRLVHLFVGPTPTIVSFVAAASVGKPKKRMNGPADYGPTGENQTRHIETQDSHLIHAHH
jgi:hypothetical protein